MRNHTKLGAVLCVMSLIAACGGDGATSTTGSVTPTTASEVTTTPTTKTAVTSTTLAPVDTTTGGVSATGDLASLHTAMAATAEAIPSRVEGVITIEGLPVETGEDSAELTFTILTDAASGDTSAVMDMGAMAEMMSGTEGMPAEMAALMGSLEVRQIDDIVYLKFPFLTAMMGATTEWVSMPAEEGAGVTGDMAPAAPSDATSFLESFGEAEGDVENLGVVDVRGISTTHYQLTIDQEWIEQLDPDQADELESQGFVPGASFPLELFVGDDGLVHRMAFSADTSNFDGAEEFESMAWTFDFFDFGQSVTIEAPPADQVSDFSILSGPFGTTAPGTTAP